MTKRSEIVLLLVIIAAGLSLRLYGLYWGQGYCESATFDELDAYRVGLGLLHGEKQAMYIAQPNFPRAGTGHLPGPLMAIFWAIPLRLGGGPETVMLMLIALDTAVIYFLYLLANKMMGGAAALWAALFYATSPWPVYYGIGCWNPQFMAPLSGLLGLALWGVMSQPRSRQIFWVCLLLAMIPQFHAFGVFLVPSILLLLSFRFREINWKWAALGALASFLLCIPYIVGEMANHWDNTRRILANGREFFSLGCLKSLTLPVACLSNLFNSPLGYGLTDYREFGRAVFGSFVVLGLFNLLSLGLSVVFVGNLVVQFARAMRGKWLRPARAFVESRVSVFLALLLFLPLILFLPTGRNFQSRYVILLLPLLCLLPGLWITKAMAVSRWRKAGLACVALTVGFNVILDLSFYRYQGRLIAGGQYFIPSFRKMEQARQKLQADAGPGRRIEVDASAFPSMPRYKQGRGMHALAQYVEICEQAEARPDSQQPVPVYRAQADTNFVDASQIVVYQGNGIALVRPRS
ncbi:MAG: hypothetical protein ABSH21_11135 [Verrucomicrobiia bacterium]|jgi:hypothetical protein